LSLPRLLLAIAVSAWAGSVAQAQPPAESGIARDARAGTPLPCLHVELLDAEDRAVAHTVTDSEGTFVLVAPAAGVYRVGFDIFGWQRLEGAADTLRDGDMRERVYPLSFGESVGPDFPDVAKLRQGEGAGWHSAAAGKPDAELRFAMSKREPAKAGAAVAQYVVDVTGRVRPDSWRPIASSHPDYLAALRAHVPAMRYQPARLDGRPVCQLVRNEVRFEWVGPVLTMTLFN
jgi:hypothetical protein